jgi:hypothetical protein
LLCCKLADVVGEVDLRSERFHVGDVRPWPCEVMRIHARRGQHTIIITTFVEFEYLNSRRLYANGYISRQANGYLNI